MHRWVLAALLVASCAEGDLVHLSLPEGTASSALLAIHHDRGVDAFVLSLPLEGAFAPPIAISDRSAYLELLMFDDSAEELFGREGKIISGTGSDPLPEARAIYTAPVFGGVEWKPVDRRSSELEAFTYDDPRVAPCVPPRAETIYLQHVEPVAELLVDDRRDLFAIVEDAPGIFRIEGSTSIPISSTPELDASTAAFHLGELWVVTGTGTVYAGENIDDHVDFTLRGRVPPGARFAIPNPYGEGLLGLTKDGLLIEVPSGRVIHQLPILLSKAEGTLAYFDAVYFSTTGSTIVGRWDGNEVTETLIPDDDFGGAIGFVPGIGLLLGTLRGSVFRFVDGEWQPFLRTSFADLNTIFPFEGGFIVSGDVGSALRYQDGSSCEIFMLSLEDLEVGVEYQNGLAFAGSSDSDRKTVGGNTPVVILRP